MAKTNWEIWYIDSGATNHMTKNKNWIEGFQNCTNKIICVLESLALSAIGSWNVEINLPGYSQSKTISNVLHVPGLSTNLLSVGGLANKDSTIAFDETICNIYLKDDCKVIGNSIDTASNENVLYRLHIITRLMRLLPHSIRKVIIYGTRDLVT
ncbi:hypothetical protein WN51_05400 [Melipona quadrifasciata]|uniref:Retrovirus-related Pol polyprotein from transposon TNT 1-94-like beta-barrel domain-containing protein n=1 Tax=Melipona quadrifasciata TaxID=166423 RepID=A0A0M8ZVR7_9HYME|nr:hypothetical protein WN51_05400 [Melipona quadrifasciata]